MNRLRSSAIVVAILVIQAVFIGCTSAKDRSCKESYADYDETWKQYKNEYGKKYRNDYEEQRRKSVFMNNVYEIEAHNRDYKEGRSSYCMGLNRFTDRTEKEYDNMDCFREERRKKRSTGTVCKEYVRPNNTKVPKRKDWRKYVTSVKDQGGCGSCWAFSAVGAIESHVAIKTNKVYSLSEQQVVNCSTTNGCDSGDTRTAFTYVIENGLAKSSLHPYVAKNGTCEYNETDSVVIVTDCYTLTNGNDEDLKTIVGTVGPVSFAIFGLPDEFLRYDHGVFTDSKCGEVKGDIGHALLLVGYGNEEGRDYWLVKNTWGENWGEEGYIKMDRSVSNYCGIANYVHFPIVGDIVSNTTRPVLTVYWLGFCLFVCLF